MLNISDHYSFDTQFSLIHDFGIVKSEMKIQSKQRQNNVVENKLRKYLFISVIVIIYFVHIYPFIFEKIEFISLLFTFEIS
jgi:uncharacterized membrane protein